MGQTFKKSHVKRKAKVYNAASDLHNPLVENYYDEYIEFACAIKIEFISNTSLVIYFSKQANVKEGLKGRCKIS